MAIFPKVPTRIVRHVTINIQKHQYESVDSLDTEIDLSYVIYTDISELKSASLSIFPFSTKF